MPSSSSTSPRPSGNRIPAALKAVFLASNQGQEVHEVPKGLANKTFVRRHNNNQGRTRWGWLRRLGRSRKKTDQSKKDAAPTIAGDPTESTTGSEHAEMGVATATAAVAASPSNTSDEASPARTSRGSVTAESTTGSEHGELATLGTPEVIPASPHNISVELSSLRTSRDSMPDINTSSAGTSSIKPVRGSMAGSMPALSSRCFYGAATKSANSPSPKSDTALPLEIQFKNMNMSLPEASSPERDNRRGASSTGALTKALEAAAMHHGKSSLPPQQFLDDLLKSRGYSTARFPALQTAYFNPPTPLQKASYGTFLLDAVRAQDVERVEAMLRAGLSPNPSSPHSDTLVHLVARVGLADVLQLLLSYGASVQCVDDLGRSPLHDACWSDCPSWHVVDLLLGQDPRLFHLTDSRGATPLSYVPSSQWQAWTDYLEDQADTYWPPRDVSRHGTQPFPSLVLVKPGERPLRDPSNVTALPIKIATLLAQGRLTPKEVRWLVKDDGDEDDDENSSDDDNISESGWSEDSYSDSQDSDSDDQDSDSDSNDEFDEFQDCVQLEI